MNNADLIANKNKILLLEKEVAELEKKEELLEELKRNYYYDYFTADRDDYALLTDIPFNDCYEKHILSDYSILNADEIGKMICDLFMKYEHKKMISKRKYVNTIYKSTSGCKDELHKCIYPILAIDSPDNINNNKNEIVINYDKYMSLDSYPTDNPVNYPSFSDVDNSFINGRDASHYIKFIMFCSDLTINYKGYEFIRELIFSLAYYQKQHDITYMSANKTMDTYRKIYKK